MTRSRLEAFSDGVIAILITIMVLELRAPEGGEWSDLRPMLPTGLAYLLSFVIIAIYWNNHHHLFAAVERIDGRVLWANMHLLFWLSLVPFATAWMGEHHDESVPVEVYGLVFLGAGMAYFVLTRALLAIHPADSALARAIGRDWKGKVSVIAYALGIAAAFVSTWTALVAFVGVAVLWLVPDRRIHRVLASPPR